MKGRKPTPTNIKILAGTRKDRVNADEPKLPPGRPVAPDYLDDVARAKWLELVEIAESMGTLTAAEGEAICIYAQAYARTRRAEAAIVAEGFMLEGKNGMRPHPAIGVIRESEAIMVRLLVEFGLTPASRSKVKTQDRAKDALGEFLNRKKKG